MVSSFVQMPHHDVINALAYVLVQAFYIACIFWNYGTLQEFITIHFGATLMFEEQAACFNLVNENCEIEC